MVFLFPQGKRSLTAKQACRDEVLKELSEQEHTTRRSSKMTDYCNAHNSFRGKHEWVIQGTPRSAMTWYLCSLCGKRDPRGEGLFYNKDNPPKDSAKSPESDIEQARRLR
jgi:hypothetical protein